MSEPSTPEQEAVPARPSATIMLVRDGRDGIEIYMVMRDRPMDGAMGAVVFPGGKVDAEDGPEAWSGATLEPPQSHPDLPFWLAAMRETFEEAGIVIARPIGTRTGDVAPSEARRMVGAHREALLDRKLTFAEIIRQERLAPALDHMVHFAHWQTPFGLPKRFDTHFFLVAAPEGQEPMHDGREMVDGFWTRPEAILDEARRKVRTLVVPTRLNLELLAESRSVHEAMERARARRIVCVRPERTQSANGEWVVAIPADAGYRTAILSSSRQK
ncbi:MAG TPA: NUDIX domain-containing protein [Hyphomicrobiaceae bacterium]|nr:NUDIX domain-containing protein [Hyphomicrobiaceae bacterium]